MYKDLYNKTPYEPLIPFESNPQKLNYKFNSITHLLSYVDHLDKTFKRGASMDSSESGDEGFSLSRNLAHAYEIIRETKFSHDDTDILQSKIRNLKRSSKFADEGYEIDVGEHLAGSDKVWLENTKRRSVTRIIDDIMFIEAVYSSHREAQTAKDLGIDVLKEIYSRGVIPRKLVVIFANSQSAGGRDVFYFVDVDFRDLNGIAKCLHPSTFRRVIFRLLEIYPDLDWGYGRPFFHPNQKHYISIEKTYDFYSGNSNPDDVVRSNVDIMLDMKTPSVQARPRKKGVVSESKDQMKIDQEMFKKMMESMKDLPMF